MRGREKPDTSIEPYTALIANELWPAGESHSRLSAIEHQLKRGTHRPVPALEKAIRDYLDMHNEEAKPFRWTKSADEIIKSVNSFFNLSGFNSPQLAAICFKGERSEGKNRVIPRQLAAGIAIFSLAVFIRINRIVY